MRCNAGQNKYGVRCVHAKAISGNRFEINCGTVTRKSSHLAVVSPGEFLRDVAEPLPLGYLPSFSIFLFSSSFISLTFDGRIALGNCGERSSAECEHESRPNQQNAEHNEWQRDQYSRQRTADCCA